MRRFVLVGLLVAIAGCTSGNSNSSTTPVTTATPTPVPTASPVPTATPVPPKSENYFPITNQAAYDGATSNGTSGYPLTALAPPPVAGTACSASLGTFGDYFVRVGRAIIPSNDILFNGNYQGALISKNAAGDVYVVGYLTGGSVENCVQPYPIAKAQMVKGTGWTFVDIAGVSRTAVVVSDHVTATFPWAGSTTSGNTTYTGIVSQVAYGSDQTIYWAAGYGPVFTINPDATGSFPQQLSAHNWVLDPASK